ncbi:MAG: ABC transporter permease subunit, partial [Rickettsiaceae bacterium]|nr:ABC transporter permease subunit [Rickettsiaceae bacterium]
MKFFTRESVYKKHSKPIYDVFTIILFAAFLILVGLEEQEVKGTLSELKSNPVSLDYNRLFEYSIYTSFRMFLAIVCSTIFGILYGLVAAKNPKLETILVPLLDVLQSVPVLGFISFTVTGFLNMFPGQRIGAELAVVFAIFTSQAWNIAFSVYSSIKTMPKDLIDLSRSIRLNGWLKFWIVELPYATPGRHDRLRASWPRAP